LYYYLIIFQGEKFVLSQTKFNDVLKNKLIAEIFLGSENYFLSCKLGEELDKKVEKTTEIMSYMKKYSVEGVKNPWSKALEAFRAQRYRKSLTQKKEAEKPKEDLVNSDF